MFATRFSSLITEHPQEADALQRVAAFFQDFEERQGENVYRVRLNPNRLFDISQAGSAARLAKVIQILLSAHLLERRIIVKSPLGGGVEFLSYAELPRKILDPLRDVEMEVTEENIEANYVVLNDRH